MDSNIIFDKWHKKKLAGNLIGDDKAEDDNKEDMREGKDSDEEGNEGNLDNIALAMYLPPRQLQSNLHPS